jgi:2,4-dienoyl-CoA reductase [(3E)-enoyl-CoA-producing], peroxisomal
MPPYDGSPFTPNCLEGHVALVTGGTSGIGLEIARCLGIHGCKVAVCGRRQNVLDEAVMDLKSSGVDAIGVQGDVRKEADCNRWVSEVLNMFGSLSILINCAAGNFLVAAEDLSVNGFRTVMEIDAVGTFNMCRAAFPALSNAQNASIISISATLHYGATWFQVHASAAKAAVDSITRSLALEWGGRGIRVNAIAPGPIQGTAGLSKLAPGSDDALDAVEQTIPVGRAGQRSDIALACVYLSCTAASFVSGHVLVVDGAAWMWKAPLVPRAAVAKVSRSIEKSSREVGTARSKL